MEISKNKVKELILPDKIKTDVISFLDEVSSLFKNILSSVYIYGASTTGEFIENVSAVNLLIVLEELDVSLIEQIADKASKYKESSSIIPRFVANKTLLSGLDVFALDYYSIRKTGILVAGNDILTSASIKDKDLIFQLERDVKAMRMKLIQTYWMGSGNVMAIRKALFVNLRQLLTILSVALDIKKIEYKGNASIIDLGAGSFGYDKDVLKNLIDIRKGSKKLNKNELLVCFRDFFDIIAKLDDYFDNWNK